MYKISFSFAILLLLIFLSSSITYASETKVYLSDIIPISQLNGWGPFEKDKSNGGQNSNDGGDIKLNGKVYKKGLGVHANSELKFKINSNYKRFKSYIAVDDPKEKGTVIFQILLDGKKVFDSGIMNGSSKNKLVDIDVSNHSEIKLIVNDAGDGKDFDSADWADAHFLATEVNKNVWLDEMPIYAGDHYKENMGDSLIYYWSPVEDTDTQGNSYSHGLKYRLARWNGKKEFSWVYNDYLLNGKYKYFSGKMCISSSDPGWNTNKMPFSALKVYGDGKLIYTSKYINDTNVLAFKIPINNVKILRVAVEDIESSTSGTIFGLVDPLLISEETQNNKAVLSKEDLMIKNLDRTIKDGSFRWLQNGKCFAYWNLFISTDTDAVKAYGLKIADDFFNNGFIKKLRGRNLTKERAEKILVAFLEDSNMGMQETAALEASSDIVKDYIKAIDTYIKVSGKYKELIPGLEKLKNDQEKYAKVLKDGDLDKVTKAFAETYNSEQKVKMKKMIAEFELSPEMPKFLKNISGITKGMDLAIAYKDQIVDITKLKKASEKYIQLLGLLESKAIDFDVKNAAKNVKKRVADNLAMSISKVTIELAAQEVTSLGADNLNKVMAKTISDLGFKKITSIMWGIDIGKFSSDKIFHVNDVLKSYDNIRVLSNISLALSSNISGNVTIYVLAAGNKAKKQDYAEKIYEYLPYLIHARELGEEEYYTIMKNGHNNIFQMTSDLINGYKGKNEITAWYKNFKEKIDQKKKTFYQGIENDIMKFN